MTQIELQSTKLFVTEALDNKKEMMRAEYGNNNFGDRIIEGIARIGRDNVRISSGTNVMSAPKGAFVHSASMVDKAVDAAAEQKTTIHA